MIRVCQSREDRIANIKYYEEVRHITTKIREDYDKVRENNFHYKFYKNIRPDFMEPLPKPIKK